jgi:hypothetical protein
LRYKNNVSVTPGNSYTVVVGASGSAGGVTCSGGNGGNSYFCSTSVVNAPGGSKGTWLPAQIHQQLAVLAALVPQAVVAVLAVLAVITHIPLVEPVLVRVVVLVVIRELEVQALVVVVTVVVKLLVLAVAVAVLLLVNTKAAVVAV